MVSPSKSATRTLNPSYPISLGAGPSPPSSKATARDGLLRVQKIGLIDLTRETWLMNDVDSILARELSPCYQLEGVYHVSDWRGAYGRTSILRYSSK